MTPGHSPSDVADQRLVDAVALHEKRRWFVTVQNGSSLLGGQFGIWMISARRRVAAVAPLTRLVSHIVGNSSAKQVCGIDARRVVACVTNQKPTIPTGVVKRHANPMGIPLSVGKTEPAISCLETASQPFPTVIWARLVNQRPELGNRSWVDILKRVCFVPFPELTRRFTARLAPFRLGMILTHSLAPLNQDGVRDGVGVDGTGAVPLVALAVV